MGKSARWERGEGLEPSGSLIRELGLCILRANLANEGSKHLQCVLRNHASTCCRHKPLRPVAFNCGQPNSEAALGPPRQ